VFTTSVLPIGVLNPIDRQTTRHFRCRPVSTRYYRPFSGWVSTAFRNRCSKQRTVFRFLSNRCAATIRPIHVSC
jgi:hypothetical protein